MGAHCRARLGCSASDLPRPLIRFRDGVPWVFVSYQRAEPQADSVAQPSISGMQGESQQGSLSASSDIPERERLQT